MALTLALAGATHAATLTSGDLIVRVDEPTGTVMVADRLLGPILGPLTLVKHLSDREGDEAPVRPLRVTREERGASGATLALSGPRGVAVTVRIIGGGTRVEIGTTVYGVWVEDAVLRMGSDPLIGWGISDRESDRGVLTTTLGHPRVYGATTVFDRQRDLAVSVDPGGEGGAIIRNSLGADDPYQIEAAAHEKHPLALTIRRHYYRDTLGIRYYAPIEKRSYWKTAPCVAMTWYGLPGYTGRPAQTRERLWPQIEWVAKNLAPYDPDLVFQLDDNYALDDTHMRAVSDHIREMGMIPGVWFTPFTTAPDSLHDTHPEWFLHSKDGKPIDTFGGISYNHHTLNVHNPEAVRERYRKWWEKVCYTWGYDFFKIDGQPNVADAYRAAADGGGIEWYRRGLRMGRTVVGLDRFINGCWGTTVDGIGILNGSRTGGDTGDQPHAMDVVLRWNFLNNVVWWSDPDAAANLARATVERARLNTTARALTGQQFLTDDLWTNVPQSIAHVWQRGMPNLDIRPANLYPIENWAAYDTIDLKISKPGMAGLDVVALMNYGNAPKLAYLDLSRLHLEGGPYHIFSYWDGRYLGIHGFVERIPVMLAPYEARVFSLHQAVEGWPTILSTSRHITQGALELEGVRYRDTKRGTIMEYRSSHLVAGDPYAITFYTGEWTISRAWSTAGTPAVTRSGEVETITFTPTRSGSAEWGVEFSLRTRPVLVLAPTEVDLPSPADGGPAATELTLGSLGPGRCRWQVAEASEWLEVTPREGEFGTGSPVRISVRARIAGLALGAVHEGKVTIRPVGPHPGGPVTATFRLQTPFPRNLARDATATASSAWPGDYGAARVNDGDRATRWNSARGDENGCWVELRWPEPVTLDTLRVDEVTTWGLRIQEWAVEAGVGALAPVASGSTVGSDFVIRLPNLVRADRVRFVAKRVTEVPTISELEVYDCRP